MTKTPDELWAIASILESSSRNLLRHASLEQRRERQYYLPKNDEQLFKCRGLAQIGLLFETRRRDNETDAGAVPTFVVMLLGQWVVDEWDSRAREARERARRTG